MTGNLLEKRYGVLKRLVCADGETKYQGHYVYCEDAPTVAIDLGPIGTDLWSLPLPKCPDCHKGDIVWAEAGYVPGARACQQCDSMFTLTTWDDLERTATLVDRWQQEYNQTRNDCLRGVDKRYAAQLGLPTLAALHDLADRVERATGAISPQEILPDLDKLIAVARGEAEARIRELYRRADGAPRLPGLTYPQHHVLGGT